MVPHNFSIIITIQYILAVLMARVISRDRRGPLPIEPLGSGRGSLVSSRFTNCSVALEESTKACLIGKEMS